MSSWLELYGLAFLGAFGGSALLTLLWSRLATRVGLVDHPHEHKFHRHATPVGGGVAIYLSSLVVLLFEPLREPATLTLVAAGLLLTLVGLLDDLRHVPATVKFGLLIGITLLLWQFGVGAHTTRIVVVDVLITALWITGVSSAFNAIDNMDGLATGVTAIAAAAFFVVALQTGQWVFGGLCVVLLGSSLGFLTWNFPPARIFMGDAGSFYLGFMLASLGLMGDWNSNELIAAIIPILVLGLPIFDLSFTVIVRHMSGVTKTWVEALNHCATDHLSHRLVALGLSTRATLAVLYLLALSFAISAISLQNAGSWVGVLHLLQALVLVAALSFLLVGPGIAAERPATRRARALRWLPLVLAGAALVGLIAANT